MKLDISPCPDVWMNRGSITRLDQATGTRLRCLEGCFWVTLDGDPNDVILEPGESWIVPGPQRVITQAMQPGRLRVEAGAACAAAPRDTAADMVFA